MRYAMVLKNRVIDIIESNIIPYYPPDAQGNPVIAFECDETVEVGMIYNEETGEFTEYIPPTPTPSQLDRIEELLNKNYAQAQQDAVDAYTLELLEGGVI